MMYWHAELRRQAESARSASAKRLRQQHIVRQHIRQPMGYDKVPDAGKGRYPVSQWAMTKAHRPSISAVECGYDKKPRNVPRLRPSANGLRQNMGDIVVPSA
jgi:hypothetical protein